MNGGAPVVTAARAACHLVGQMERVRFFASKHACAKRGALPRVANSIVLSTRVHAPGMGYMRIFVRSTGPWTQMLGCAVLASLKRFLQMQLLDRQPSKKRVDLGVSCRRTCASHASLRPYQVCLSPAPRRLAMTSQATASLVCYAGLQCLGPLTLLRN